MKTAAKRTRQLGVPLLLLAGLAGCSSTNAVDHGGTDGSTTRDPSQHPDATGQPDATARSEPNVSADPPVQSEPTVPAEPPVQSEPTVPAEPPAQFDPTVPADPPVQSAGPLAVGSIIWDDFDYASWKDPAAGAFGWRFRSGTGWPGQSGVWSADQIVFVSDPDDPSNTLMRFQAYTDGVAGASTVQCQASRQPPNTLHGTFAARTRFRPVASVGPDNPGDELTQTFYTIVGIEGTYADPGYPLPSYEPYDRDPHSELDFEFLPHGGWGWPATAMTVTTWAPNLANHGAAGTQYSGWHVWSITFDGSRVVYSIDGAVFHEETGAMPQTVMSMSFNQWFIGLGGAGGRREYWEDIDWVFYAEQEYLTNAQILERVGTLRSAGVQRLDTMK